MNDLNAIFNGVSDKALFFTNLIKTQKLSSSYSALKDAYMDSHYKAIEDHTTSVLSSIERLTTGTEVCPKKLAILAGFFSNYYHSDFFKEYCDPTITNNQDFLTYLLSYDFHTVDKKRILIVGVPIIVLDKIISLLKDLPKEQRQHKVFKMLMNNSLGE